MIYRYIFKRIFIPTLVFSIVFTLSFIFVRLKSLIELTVEKDAPVFLVFQLFLFLLPAFMVGLIAIGTLFGMVFGLERLSSSSEIIIMRASGISVYAIFFKSVIFVAICFCIFSYLLLNFIVPYTNNEYKKNYLYIVKSKPSVALQNKLFISFDSSKTRISTVEVNGEDLKGVFVEKVHPKDNTITDFIYAKSGKWTQNEVNSDKTILTLYNGQSVRMDEKQKKEISKSVFKEMKIVIYNSVGGLDRSILKKGYRELNHVEILNLRKEKKDRKADSSFWLEFHRRITFPLVSLLFTLAVFPFAVISPRVGRGIGYIWAIFLLFVFYFTDSLSDIFVKGNQLDAFYAAYIPVVTFLIIAFLTFFFRFRKF